MGALPMQVGEMTGRCPQNPLLDKRNREEAVGAVQVNGGREGW